MSDYITTEVSVDMSGVTKAVRDILNDDTVKTEIHQALATAVDPWIPFDTGNMSQEEIEINADGVRYYAYYAHEQYYNTEFNHTRTHHPLATAYWDKVAMQTQRDKFAQDVADIIARRFNSNG